MRSVYRVRLAVDTEAYVVAASDVDAVHEAITEFLANPEIEVIEVEEMEMVPDA